MSMHSCNVSIYKSRKAVLLLEQMGIFAEKYEIDSSAITLWMQSNSCCGCYIPLFVPGSSSENTIGKIRMLFKIENQE